MAPESKISAKRSRLNWADCPGQPFSPGSSRGIADIAEILGAIVEFLKALEAEPFIFPAMGSHGGATAEGQVAMLEQLGVTEGSVNAKDLPEPPDSSNGRFL